MRAGTDFWIVGGLKMRAGRDFESVGGFWECWEVRKDKDRQ